MTSQTHDHAAEADKPLHRRLAMSPMAALLVLADVATLGFITLGFEMVASRILTPLFGSGIYTWATIISIAVGGLSVGYFLGGVVADRFPGFGMAAIIKLLSGAYLVMVYFLAVEGLESLIDSVEGEIAALFTAGFVICFPPLVVLGMYSPLSVRLILKLPSDAGKIAGGLFAISSLGNITGILVTTFVLIPSYGTRSITLGFAAFLFASALVSLLAASRRQRATAALA